MTKGIDMDKDENIKKALGKLDPKNDNHWTADGMPRLESVRIFAGDNALKREDLTRAAPEFSRNNPSTETKVDEPGKSDEQEQNDAENKPDTGQTTRPDAGQTDSPETGGAKTDGSEPASAPGPASAGEQDKAAGHGAGEKKPNDMQGVYTRTEGIDSEGNVVGVQMPDLPSVAGQPGGTAPEHIPQTTTVPEIHPESNADQQAEGSDGTSVVIHGLPNQGITNDERDADVQTTEDGSDPDDDSQVDDEIADLNKQLDEVKSKLDAAQQKKDDRIAAREKKRGQDSNANAIRSYLDSENQRRTEAGRVKQSLMHSGFDVKAAQKAMDPRSPLDKSKADRPRPV